MYLARYRLEVPRNLARPATEWSRWVRSVRASTRSASKPHKPMSQTEFGAAIGRERGAVADWETAVNRPDAESIAKIVKAFPQAPLPPLPMPQPADRSMSDPVGTVRASPESTGGKHGGLIVHEDEQEIRWVVEALRKCSPAERAAAALRALNAIMGARTAEAANPPHPDVESAARPRPDRSSRSGR